MVDCFVEVGVVDEQKEKVGVVDGWDFGIVVVAGCSVVVAESGAIDFVVGANGDFCWDLVHYCWNMGGEWN